MSHFSQSATRLMQVQSAREFIAKSRSKTVDRSRISEQSGIEAEAFRRWFAPAFARWLQDHFARPEAVAVAFGVRNSTAWNWWNAENRASGDAVALVFLTFPQAAAWFLAEWRERIR